jgi:integrase
MSRREKPVEKDFPNDQATIEWLKAQKKGTAATYKSYWKLFLEFTGMNGTKILESKKQDSNHDWEKKVMTFRTWLETKKKLSSYGGKTGVAVVRGFFAFHYSPLSYRRIDATKLKNAKRKSEDYLFLKEDLLKMAEVGDVTQRYILLAGKSFGLRAGDFLELKRGDLEPYINREPPISIGKISTEKEIVYAFPFIDSDAKPVIEAMLRKMTSEGKTNPSDKMLDVNEEALTYNLQEMVKKSAINIGNKTVRFHNLRKYLIDRLSAITSESKWKQIVGKTIDEKAYVSPQELEEIYSKVMPLTCITNNNRVHANLEKLEQRVTEQEVTIKALMEQIEKNTEERLEEIGEVKDYQKRLRELETMVLKLLSEKTQK